MTGLLFILILAVQADNLYAYEIIFDRITAKSGLKSDFVLCVGQSADGFIWVGTQSGLQRFDGYRMATFYSKDPKTQIPPKPVDQIIQSGDKNQIWVRTGSTVGLFSIQDFSYKNIPIKIADSYGVTLYRCQSGKTYLVVKGKAVLTFNSNKNIFEEDPDLREIPKDFQPNVLQLLPNGDFYLAGLNGIGYFDKRGKKFYTAGNNPQKNKIIEDASSLRWIRLFFLDSKGRAFFQLWPPRSGQEVYLLRPERSKLLKLPLAPMEKDSYFGLDEITELNGLIWGHGGGIFNVFDGASRFESFYDHKDPIYGISSTHIFQLFKDKDNNIWVATNNGLYMAFVVGNYMRNASMGNLFGNHDQTSVLELGKGTFLLGSWGGGVQAFSYDKEHVLSKKVGLATNIYRGWPNADLNYKMVWDMATDKGNNIWLGCQHGRLIRYDRLRMRSDFSNPPVFAGETIRTIKVDRDNVVWFGTQGGKLVSFSNGQFKLEADFKTIISKIFLDRSGELWIGTGGKGLVRYSPGKRSIVSSYRRDEKKNSLSSDKITDVTQVNDTLMAVACDANLDLLNLKTGNFKNLNPYNGLEQNIISSLIADKKGFLWMSSNGGVARLDTRKMRFRYYDQKDGMVTTSEHENLMTISHIFRDNDLFFAGNKNSMIFNPDSLNRRFVPKDVVITGFQLFDTYLPLAEVIRKGAISLKSNQNVFTVQFSSLSYKQTKQLKYYYKLEGASDSWIQVEEGQSASFASLPPGKYTFMVYAINQEEIRSPKITQLIIEIVPEFYQTRWFVLLIVLICLLPIFIIYRLRIKRTVDVYRLREKVARDLHDDMGSTLTSISILSEVAKRGLRADQGDTLECIEKIGANSSQMMESMDDIVWSIKPDNDQLSRILVRLREHTTQILEPQEIDYEFIADDQIAIVTLTMDARRNLFLIYKEALNNISKYASATRVRIEIVHKDRVMKLSIEDNGNGFDMGILSEGNGLMNMRKRAELMKGTMDISSTIGLGTVIVLKIPL